MPGYAKNPNPQGKREHNKAANRAAILESGRQCFVEQGFEAITIRDIIRRTNLASGTFYNYFRTKQEVFDELLQDRMSALNENLTQTRRSASSTHDFIYGAYSIAFTAVAEDPLFYGVIMRNTVAVREMFEDNIMGMSVQALESDIQDAIDRGLFSGIDDVDIKYLAAAFFGVAFEIGRVLAQRENRDPDAAAQFASRLFMHGVDGKTEADNAFA